MNVKEMLWRIDPASLSYDEWLRVGMALHYEGEDWTVWDEWSQRDPERYRPGDCEKRWKGFGNNSGSRVTGATILFLSGHAKNQQGVQLNDPLEPDDFICEDRMWRLSNVRDLYEHFKWLLENAFEAGEKVNIVIPNKEGKPTSAGITRTREEWLEDSNFYQSALKTSNGMFIRINPVDGNGVGNENITKFRHMLIESDDAPISDQIRAFEKLPVTALIFSGKASVHAWVRVDAKTKEEYVEISRKMLDIVSQQIPVDKNTKNPSRLSRCPGFLRRNGVVSPQAIVKPGKSGTAREFLEKHDGLPEILIGVSLNEKMLPPMSPELIYGVLRHGHKLMLAGPSKSGKSFALISLALAIANGAEWFGQKTKKGKVLYVNLEIDRASCIHRFYHVAKELSYQEYQPNLSIWNLRGYITEPRRFLEAIKRRANDICPDIMIIDPVYVLNDGDEIKANDVKRFLSLLDEAAMTLASMPSIAFSHHFPKGDMAVRDAKDRPSGSGVFARHPDAICTMTPMEVENMYRVDWILREFESPQPSIWEWKYPAHRFVDFSDFKSSGPMKSREGKRKQATSKIREILEKNPDATPEEIAELSGMSKRSVYRWLKKINPDVTEKE